MTPKPRPVPVLTAKMRQRFEEFVDPLDFCGKFKCDEHALNGLAAILLARSEALDSAMEVIDAAVKWESHLESPSHDNFLIFNLRSCAERATFHRLLARFRTGRPR